MQAQWMWNFGDFEIWHSLLLHARRQEFGADYPAMWHTDSPEKTVTFRWHGAAERPGSMRVTLCGIGYALLDGHRYPSDTEILIPAGEHTVDLRVVNVTGLPCAYVESDVCPSGDGWLCGLNAYCLTSVGTDAAFRCREATPEVFPFSYTPLEPVSKETVRGGVLYDYGRETFARVTLRDVFSDALIVYGESREEALDRENAVLWQKVSAGEDAMLPARAFRYLYVTGGAKPLAEAEYTPRENRGAFRCTDEKMNRIWDVSAYTFGLNSREFFLDGIKRDRWVWSGDAYQSYMVNRYLFADDAIARRTILALRGRDEMPEHINTILDYSMYWLLSVRDHWFHTGDADFVRRLLPRMESLLRYVEKDKDENGFLTGGEGAWIFIDWSDMDKTGAICAEQMLYIASLRAMAECEELCGNSGRELRERADDMCRRVRAFYYDAEQGAFIDSYTSGKRHVTRHANLFAVMYGIATQEETASIVRNVILNDSVTQITTPYFKFFEMDVLCRLGMRKQVTERIRAYWGGMLELGATSIWEQFDPSAEGVEHYAMYGHPFGCSLCHAWGAGPIYLLGRWYLGVHPTAPAWETFEVEPDDGGLGTVSGTVPVPGGSVYVSMDADAVRVRSDIPGGTLAYGGRRIPLPAGEEVAVPRL